ncbi:MAG: pyridoxal phosphate-dependent aminotransferase [Deltaproteobacteria bacterium]|nr:pyridoxal phosphate-dependent aminotransferase [Deltaproteobacteria bacterium]
MTLSRRAQQIQPSATLAITAKANQLKAQGVDVIGFGAGEPDFPTPPHIVERAAEALRKGDTRYTSVGGTPALRSAVAAALQRDYGLTYRTAEITASCGAKHTLFNLFLALVDDGDEVIVPAPYWVSYPEQVQVAGGVPVIVSTEEADGFLLRPEALAQALTPRSKALVLNSPSNPTGAMYGRDELAALARVLDDRDVVVVSDDIYHKLTYDGARFVSLLGVAPSLRDRTVIVNGVSKTYAMTGWRIGYAAGPERLIQAMEDLQSQSTSNPTSFAQAGAVEALSGPQACVGEMVAAFDERRRLLVAGLDALPGVRCPLPQGAFYAFPNVSGVYGSVTPSGVEIRNSLTLAAYLLEEAQVAVVPGGPFGADDYIRLSYATSLDNIRKGLGRVAEALGRLRRS